MFFNVSLNIMKFKLLQLLYFCELFDWYLFSNNFKQFDDSILFKLNWPGTLEEHHKDHLISNEWISLRTENNEKYECAVPLLIENTKSDDFDYHGPSASSLMNILFSQVLCSYRIEQYWTYELCHGKFLRQFHEEKEIGRKVSLQEYYLGKYYPEENKGEQGKEDPGTGKVEIPSKKVELEVLPYYLVNMTHGTTCDLIGKPRKSRILYVCHPQGKQEIFSLEEVSTCEYEVVVLTAFLCTHPQYKLMDNAVTTIDCHSVGNSSPKPLALQELEAANAEGDFIRKQASSTLKPASDSTSGDSTISSHTLPPGGINDKELLQQFLKGDYCLFGGTGWWQHEFCYGKKVTQYHEDKINGRTEIVLGSWNEEVHLDWIQQHSSKRPKPISKRVFITLLYSNGDFCGEIGKHRSVEVKLRCKEMPGHPNAVTIYLMEPKICEYILGVESPIICSLLPLADENGLFQL